MFVLGIMYNQIKDLRAMVTSSPKAARLLIYLIIYIKKYIRKVINY